MNTPSGKLTNVKVAHANLELMRKIGCPHDKLALDQLDLSLSPLRNGEWGGEFGRAFGLKPETWTELVSVLSRISSGLRPGDPFPSLRDFERVLLKQSEGRAKFATAAFALRSLNVVLGKTAFIRQAPDI